MKRKQYKIWEILEYILGLIAVVGLFLFVYLHMSLELKDPDIWLHLKTGEYILQHRTIPKIDVFSATSSGQEWLDHSWLVQVIFYLVFHFGGADNLILLSAILVTSAFLFLFFSVYRRRRDLTVCVAILFIAMLASKIRFNIRPENFSILFFSFYLFVLAKHLRSKAIFLLPLIQAFWVNTHGFFILGPLILGIFIVTEKLKRNKILPWEWNKVELLDRNSYRNLLIVFCLVCIASFINPYGYKVALYPFWVAVTSIGKSAIFYNYIQELLPTWRLHRILSAYYLLVLLSLSVFFLNLKRINFAYLLLWLFFLAVSLRISRNVIFFNFVAFLTITDTTIKGLKIKKLKFIEKFFGKSRYLLKLMIAVLLISLVLRTNYSILGSQYYVFEEHRMKSSLLGVTAKGYPVKAADFILKKQLPGNVLNLFNYGSYLIYRLFPKNKIFIDGRTELYGDEFFKVYKRVLTGDKATIEDALARYSINIVLLSGDVVDIGNLMNYFFNRPDWALIYLDKDSLMFLKDDFKNKILVSQLRIDLKNWTTPKVDLDKIGLKKIYPEPYIKRAWKFYYLGLDAQATSEANEALRILPSCPDAYSIIGREYLKQKLYDKAFETLRLSRIYGPANRETLIGLGDYYTQQGKFNDAVNVYKDLTKLYPYYAEGYYLLGYSLLKINNQKLALKSLKKALKLDPFQARFYKELGESLFKFNDLKGAARVYQKAIAMKLDTKYFQEALDNLYKKTPAQK